MRSVKSRRSVSKILHLSFCTGPKPSQIRITGSHEAFRRPKSGPSKGAPKTQARRGQTPKPEPQQLVVGLLQGARNRSPASLAFGFLYYIIFYYIELIIFLLFCIILCYIMLLSQDGPVLAVPTAAATRQLAGLTLQGLANALWPLERAKKGGLEGSRELGSPCSKEEPPKSPETDSSGLWGGVLALIGSGVDCLSFREPHSRGGTMLSLACLARAGESKSPDARLPGTRAHLARSTKVARWFMEVEARGALLPRTAGMAHPHKPGHGPWSYSYWHYYHHEYCSSYRLSY